MILYNSAVSHLIVFPSILVLLAEKDVRASMSLLPVTSHGSFSNSDLFPCQPVSHLMSDPAMPLSWFCLALWSDWLDRM